MEDIHHSSDEIEINTLSGKELEKEWDKPVPSQIPFYILSFEERGIYDRSGLERSIYVPIRRQDWTRYE